MDRQADGADDPDDDGHRQSAQEEEACEGDAAAVHADDADAQHLLADRLAVLVEQHDLPDRPGDRGDADHEEEQPERGHAACAARIEIAREQARHHDGHHDTGDDADDEPRAAVDEEGQETRHARRRDHRMRRIELILDVRARRCERVRGAGVGHGVLPRRSAMLGRPRSGPPLVRADVNAPIRRSREGSPRMGSLRYMNRCSPAFSPPRTT